MSLPGFELPGYEILEKLGEGGMAVVWKARQISLDRMVAIKILMPEWRQDTDAMARFRKESMAAARLKHSGIIQVFDAGETVDAVYFVMEFIDGYTIGHRIHKRGALDEETALDITLGVAAALSYAWESTKTIHCDIKPDNIMIDHDGTVKVADLGLARALGPSGSTGHDDYIVGTPNYISPEQARGEANLDCATDVYALGATLYHMVTGRLPFGDTPGTAPLERQQTDFLLDPLDLNQNLTPALGALIERMMIKDRTLRPAVWNNVIADLQEVREGYLPPGDLPPAGASTVLRGAWRIANPGKHRMQVNAPKKNVMTISAGAFEPGASHAAQTTPALARRPRNWTLVIIQIIIIASLIAIGLGATYMYLALHGKLDHLNLRKNKSGEVKKLPRALPKHTGTVERASASNTAATTVLVPAPRAIPDHVEPVAVTRTNAAPVAVPATQAVGVAAARTNAPPVPAAQHVPRSAHYQRAGHFFNYALDLYSAFSGKMNIPVVQRVEIALRQAVSDFNASREAQTDKGNVERRIQRCFQLLADARLSSKVAPPPGFSASSLPPLPSMDLPPEPPPEAYSNLAARVSAPAAAVAATTATTAVAVVTPPAPAGIQPAPVDEAALAAAWKTKPATRTAVMDEFRDLISLYAPDTEAGTQNLMLYDRVAYGAPAADAARVFGATAGAMQPLNGPLFPAGQYFVHDLSIPPVNGFNRLLLVVDRSDRVRAVQLMTEQPDDPAFQLPTSLFQARWRCYDFVRGATKANARWKIGYRVALIGKLARLDCELASDDATAAYGLGSVRARVYLYFPQVLAARMLERVDTP
jgi:serine/threonine-protein kinase